MIPLTKTLNPADLDEPEMRDQLVQVDKHWDTQQHPLRRWEYALALLALSEWKKQEASASDVISIADVGGAASSFHLMTSDDTTVIDPLQTGSGGFDYPVEVIARRHTGVYDAVVSISTFEHTSNPLAFLEACCTILKPGGLLFLTFDYAPNSGKDTYHFNWMRERIVNHLLWGRLAKILHALHGYDHFGDVDWISHGPHVYDYAFASLCLKKGAD